MRRASTSRAIKGLGAKVLHDVIDRAIRVHGALGVPEDTPLANMYRQARFARIYDGPDESHRMVVSRQLRRTCKKRRLGFRRRTELRGLGQTSAGHLGVSQSATLVNPPETPG